MYAATGRQVHHGRAYPEVQHWSSWLSTINKISNYLLEYQNHMTKQGKILTWRPAAAYLMSRIASLRGRSRNPSSKLWQTITWKKTFKRMHMRGISNARFNMLQTNWRTNKRTKPSTELLVHDLINKWRGVTISLRTGGQGQKCTFSHFSTRSPRTDQPTNGRTDKASYSR